MKQPGSALEVPHQRLARHLLRRWVTAWMFVRRIPALESAAWWLSDLLVELASLIRQGSESMTLYRLEAPSPEQVLGNVLRYNARASRVRKPAFDGRTWVAVVRCMDRKLDMGRVFGDMKFVDDIANPYGAVTPREIEALQLAVSKHGVRLVCLLTHTDCAALAVASGPDGSAWPLISAAVDATPRHVEALLQAPVIAPALKAGTLAVIRATVITGTDRLTDVRRYQPQTRAWEPVAS